MAIYHMHTQIISRSSGRSSVAAAAYRSGEQLTDERTGITHDYTRKSGVDYSEIILPTDAPERWSDRSTLWGEVERTEKAANAQLAREINYALPRELDFDSQVILAREYAQLFADEGMVVDCAIHDSSGDNPHVHMMMSMRPCNIKGFSAKSENLYLVRSSGGEEQNVNAAELKALGGGWTKVYTYKNGEALTQEEAAAAGLHKTKDRKGKQPIQETRYFVDWNDSNKVDQWRERLAQLQNYHLARAGNPARVDHRNYVNQGVEKIPTLHEGATVCQIEKREQERAERLGYEYQPISERRRENLSIKELNDKFRNMIEKLKESYVAIRQSMVNAKGRGKQKDAHAHNARKPQRSRGARRSNGMQR